MTCPPPKNRSMLKERIFDTHSVRPPNLGGFCMSRKRHTPEQIISKPREAEVLLSQGQSVPGACKTIEVSEQTYYRWRKEWGGLRLEQAKRFKELERENGRLKKLVAEQALDNAILKEVASGNF